MLEPTSGSFVEVMARPVLVFAHSCKQPRQRNVGMKTRFRHYVNLHRTEERLKALTRDFRWGRMDDIFMVNN